MSMVTDVELPANKPDILTHPRHIVSPPVVLSPPVPRNGCLSAVCGAEALQIKVSGPL